MCPKLSKIRSNRWGSQYFVVTVSYADALYKSFKLTVSVNDVAKNLMQMFGRKASWYTLYVDIERNPQNSENNGPTDV